MFLSKIALDPRSRLVAEQLRDPYKMHQTLCLGFPELQGQDIQQARLLFRVDDDKDQLFIVAQSKTAPDWSKVDALPHYARAITLKSFAFVPEADKWLRFRLLANPTKASSTVRKAKRSRGQRVGLYREWERLDWLARQGERHGFAFDLKPFSITRTNEGGEEEQFSRELPLVRLVDLNDGRRFPIKDHGAQFSAALFEGELRVTDATLFAHALENGIGKARGFGFGLLSVAPTAS